MADKDIEKINEIEGDDDSQSDSWGDYPLDTVFVRNDTRTVGDVVSRIKKGRYILDPEFQRDFVWEPQKQARLIESCLMRIPLPVFYVAEDEHGKIIVVDGLQRLTTFFKYLEDEFSLKGIGSDDPNSVIKDKKFSELPINLQERIEDTQLILYILDSKAPERARLDIFERVNSGVPLTRQQMRNCLYTGPATRWLKAAIESEEFLKATDNSLNSKSMRDREVVNRFCAFYLLDIENYRGDMDEYLAESLSLMNKLSPNELADLMTRFKEAMKFSYELFDKHSFRKSLIGKEIKRPSLNISLFDALSVGFAKNIENLITQGNDNVKRIVRTLMKYEKFENYISYSTNNTQRVHTRHNLVRSAFSMTPSTKVEIIILTDVIQDYFSKRLYTADEYCDTKLANKFYNLTSEASQQVDWYKNQDILKTIESNMTIDFDNYPISQSDIQGVLKELLKTAKSLFRA